MLLTIISYGYTAKSILKIIDRFYMRAITNFSRWRILFLIIKALKKENEINV